jgi:Arc/MetJ-type ribon-helix-helix transcriptional regulator
MGGRSKNVVVSVKLPRELVERLDLLVNAGVFRSRNEAIRTAIEELVSRTERDLPVVSYR